MMLGNTVPGGEGEEVSSLYSLHTYIRGAVRCPRGSKCCGLQWLCMQQTLCLAGILWKLLNFSTFVTFFVLALEVSIVLTWKLMTFFYKAGFKWAKVLTWQLTFDNLRCMHMDTFKFWRFLHGLWTFYLGHVFHHVFDSLTCIVWILVLFVQFSWHNAHLKTQTQN